MFGKMIVPLESYTLLELCLATYIFKFASKRVSKSSFSFPMLPLHCLFTALLSYFFLLLPKEIENSITSVRKLNPREQSNSSEQPLPGEEPILEYNFANPVWFSGLEKDAKQNHFEAWFWQLKSL